MKERIFGEERITINGLFTFKKSDINGIYSEHFTSQITGQTFMKLYVVVNGNSINVDTKPYLTSGDSLYMGESEKEQLTKYHRKWEESLSNIGEDSESIKKERKEI